MSGQSDAVHLWYLGYNRRLLDRVLAISMQLFKMGAFLKDNYGLNLGQEILTRAGSVNIQI